MTIKIVTQNEYLDEGTKSKIKDIFNQSNCPNESLIASLPGFVCMQGNTLYFCDISVPCKLTEEIEI
ncbi:hypothetical protein [Pectinatus haikarae]|uniref:Uncharacterized protein n=1 Tax=Pectinatus haikarae TaxID=349096 RepID=A0ABT9Y3Q6_9FIRM|nr:hypothetical protein [Pectinatus haikarae]MDQ0202460.1 hypothetical protein [Pectinatus haikarae]